MFVHFLKLYFPTEKIIEKVCKSTSHRIRIISKSVISSRLVLFYLSQIRGPVVASNDRAELVCLPTSQHLGAANRCGTWRLDPFGLE